MDAWSRAAAAVARLTIPSPFDMGQFIAALADQRGKPIRLMPMEHQAGSPCGTLVSTDNTDFIYYAANTTSLHADHIALHEVGHMVLDHEGMISLTAQTARALFPSLSPELLRRLLGRTAYGDDNEREAELFASMVLETAARTADGGTRVDRFREIFGS